MPQYKVTYFDVRGLAESIRLILAYSGTPFEDNRLEFGSLTPDKKEELGLEWGQVPMLEIDGKKKSQTYAICRYLAKKFNLVGKNEDEEFRCDEIVEAVRDFVSKTQNLYGSFFANDEVKVEECKKQLEEVDAPVYLARFNNLLEKQGKTWLVGDNLTWADIVFVHILTTVEIAFGVKLVKGHKAIEKLVNAVQSEPKIKEWIKNRPVTKL